MSLRLPVLGSVDRSKPVDPFYIPDPEGSPVAVRYGAHPADPAPFRHPIHCGRSGSYGPNVFTRH
jgi:hypothetical protein